MQLAPLHQAAEAGDTAVVVAELDRGTEIELGTPGYRETALHRAAEHGHLSVVNALIARGCNVNATRRGGFTALHLAATEAVADALLAAGVDPSIRASNGFTAMQQCSGGAAVRFHIAASPGPAKIVAAEAAAVQTGRGALSTPLAARGPTPRFGHGDQARTLAGGPEEAIQARRLDSDRTHRPASPTSALRTELQSMRLKALRQRARAHGVGDSVMESLSDNEDPKQAVIELLLRTERQGEDSQIAAMRSKLLSLKTSEIHQRALACGVTEDEIEHCYDSDAPKHAMVSLILSSPHAAEDRQSQATPTAQRWAEPATAMPALALSPKSEPEPEPEQSYGAQISGKDHLVVALDAERKAHLATKEQAEAAAQAASAEIASHSELAAENAAAVAALEVELAALRLTHDDSIRTSAALDASIVTVEQVEAAHALEIEAMRASLRATETSAEDKASTVASLQAQLDELQASHSAAAIAAAAAADEAQLLAVSSARDSYASEIEALQSSHAAEVAELQHSLKTPVEQLEASHAEMAEMQTQHDATISEMRAAAAQASAMQLSEAETQAALEYRAMREAHSAALAQAVAQAESEASAAHEELEMQLEALAEEKAHALGTVSRLETELHATRLSHEESAAQMMEWTAAHAAEETHLFAATLADAHAEVESVRSSMISEMQEMRMEHSAALEEAEERVAASPRSAEMKLAAISAELQTETEAASTLRSELDEMQHQHLSSIALIEAAHADALGKAKAQTLEAAEARKRDFDAALKRRVSEARSDIDAQHWASAMIQRHRRQRKQLQDTRLLIEAHGRTTEVLAQQCRDDVEEVKLRMDENVRQLQNKHTAQVAQLQAQIAEERERFARLQLNSPRAAKHSVQDDTALKAAQVELIDLRSERDALQSELAATTAAAAVAKRMTISSAATIETMQAELDSHRKKSSSELERVSAQVLEAEQARADVAADLAKLKELHETQLQAVRTEAELEVAAMRTEAQEQQLLLVEAQNAVAAAEAAKAAERMTESPSSPTERELGVKRMQRRIETLEEEIAIMSEARQQELSSLAATVLVATESKDQMLAELEAERKAHRATKEQAETAAHAAGVQIASYSALVEEKNAAVTALEAKLATAGAEAVAVAVADAVAAGAAHGEVEKRRLRADVGALGAQAADLQTSLTTLQGEHGHSERLRAELQRQTERLQEDLAAARQGEAEHGEAATAHHQALQRARDEADRNFAALEDLKESSAQEMQALREEHGSAVAAMTQKVESERLDADQVLAKLTADYESKVESLQRVTAESEAHAASVEKLQTEREEAQAAEARARTDVDRVAETESDLRRQLAALQQTLDAKLADATEKEEGAAEKEAALTGKLREAEETTRILQAEIEVWKSKHLGTEVASDAATAAVDSAASIAGERQSREQQLFEEADPPMVAELAEPPATQSATVSSELLPTLEGEPPARHNSGVAVSSTFEVEDSAPSDPGAPGNFTFEVESSALSSSAGVAEFEGVREELADEAALMAMAAAAVPETDDQEDTEEDEDEGQAAVAREQTEQDPEQGDRDGDNGDLAQASALVASWMSEHGYSSSSEIAEAACEAFEAAGIPADEWLTELQDMHHENQLDKFVATLTPKSSILDAPANSQPPALSEEEKSMDTITLTKPTDGSGFGMNISADCDVTAFSSESSVAKLAGVQVGSKIIRLNGVRVSTRKDVTDVLKRAEGGEVIDFLLCPKRSLHKLPSFRDVVSSNNTSSGSPKAMSKPQTKGSGASSDAELPGDEVSYDAEAGEGTPMPQTAKPAKERRLSLSVSQGFQEIVTGSGAGTSPLGASFGRGNVAQNDADDTVAGNVDSVVLDEEDAIVYQAVEAAAIAATMEEQSTKANGKQKKKKRSGSILAKAANAVSGGGGSATPSTAAAKGAEAKRRMSVAAASKNAADRRGSIAAPSAASQVDRRGSVAAPPAASRVDRRGSVAAPPAASKVDRRGSVAAPPATGKVDRRGSVAAPPAASKVDRRGSVAAPPAASKVDRRGSVAAPPAASKVDRRGSVAAPPQ